LQADDPTIVELRRITSATASSSSRPFTSFDDFFGSCYHLDDE
jgi:hypothetical protein